MINDNFIEQFHAVLQRPNGKMSSWGLFINKDPAFVRTPKRGKLRLIVDNTKGAIGEIIEHKETGTVKEAATVG